MAPFNPEIEVCVKSTFLDVVEHAEVVDLFRGLTDPQEYCKGSLGGWLDLQTDHSICNHPDSEQKSSVEFFLDADTSYHPDSKFKSSVEFSFDMQMEDGSEEFEAQHSQKKGDDEQPAAPQREGLSSPPSPTASTGCSTCPSDSDTGASHETGTIYAPPGRWDRVTRDQPAQTWEAKLFGSKIPFDTEFKVSIKNTFVHVVPRDMVEHAEAVDLFRGLTDPQEYCTVSLGGLPHLQADHSTCKHPDSELKSSVEFCSNLPSPPPTTSTRCFTCPSDSGTGASDETETMRAPPGKWDPVTEDRPSQAREAKHEDEWTTLMIRNLPNNMSRGSLEKLLHMKGCNSYNFLYLPRDLHRFNGLGYAFVNFVTNAQAKQAKEELEGFTEWKSVEANFSSLKICTVTWANSDQQGLEWLKSTYRNSPLMHETVPDHCRPVLYENGMCIPFDPPTIKLRAPRPKKCRPKSGRSPHQ